MQELNISEGPVRFKSLKHDLEMYKAKEIGQL